MRADTAPDTQALRGGWQRRALVRYLRAKPRDFLAVATPGAGKTTFALRVAGELMADGTVERITVVVPTEHLKIQWALAAARLGISLDPKFSNSASHHSSEYHASSSPTRRLPAIRPGTGCAPRTTARWSSSTRSTTAGDAKSWGDAMREAFSDATRRLSLTGTPPFRSDDSPIPFVTYEPDGAG